MHTDNVVWGGRGIHTDNVVWGGGGRGMHTDNVVGGGGAYILIMWCGGEGHTY